MPLINVKRTGVRPSVRKVPTSTCAVVLPVTVEQVGKEVPSENTAPVEVESLKDALAKFKPKLNFKGTAGEEETEFRMENYEFLDIKDFDPENLQRRQEIKNEDGTVTVKRNDLADLKNNIDLLYRIKDRWKLPAVRRAWNNPQQRQEILMALSRLRDELQKIAGTGGGN
jgi:type VI secretion system protein ImpB